MGIIVKHSELLHIEILAERLRSFGEVRIEHEVDYQGQKLPIYSFRFGSQDPNVPTIAFVGGVHGLEVIGTQVVLSFMDTLSQLLSWDSTVHHLLQKVKLLFYPCANPGGMVGQTRSNPNGVDLMRNAPLEASGINPIFLMGGHRLSSKLPWYRGKAGKGMEAEAEALCRFVKREVSPAAFSLVLDVHSGFGAFDRIWFPFACKTDRFPQTAEVVRMKQLLDEAHPHHFYKIEPQSLQYRTHGDLWDYMYFEHQKLGSENTFIPLCLELGSWKWVRKNPKQLLQSLGLFNPIIPHRKERILRRHHILLDFLVRMTAGSQKLMSLNDSERKQLDFVAEQLWFDQRRAG